MGLFLFILSGALNITIRLYLTDPVTFEKKLTTRRGFHKLSEAKLAAKELEAEDSKVKLNSKAHYTYRQMFKEYEAEYSTHLKSSTVYRKSVDFNILKDLIRQNKKLRLQFGERAEHSFIFIKETSFDPFRNSYVNEVLTKLCKKYKLPRITVHGLRHSCASLLFAAGVDVKVVQKLLGHAHIETTMNIYTHVTTEQVEKTTDLLINFLN